LFLKSKQFFIYKFIIREEQKLVIKKPSKQELKEKTAAVKKILDIKGGSYDEWLLEKQNEFINDNLSSLIEMACEKENNFTIK